MRNGRQVGFNKSKYHLTPSAVHQGNAASTIHQLRKLVDTDITYLFGALRIVLSFFPF